MNLRGIWASFRFECARSLTLSRLAWWSAMAVFPSVILFLIRQEQPDALTDPEGFPVFLYLLVVRVLCPLGLLLWATPIIHAELEGKTWPYLAVRPHAKSSVLFGKYLAAVVWAIACGWTSVVLAFLLGPPDDTVRIAFLLGKLVVLASFAYGAVYTLIGVLFLKRAMVVTVAYTLLVEVALTFMPAVVNEATVAYRLRAIIAKELEFDERVEAWKRLVSEAPVSEQVTILVVYTMVALVAALLFLRRRQLVLARED